MQKKMTKERLTQMINRRWEAEPGFNELLRNVLGEKEVRHDSDSNLSNSSAVKPKE